MPNQHTKKAAAKKAAAKKPETAAPFVVHPIPGELLAAILANFVPKDQGRTVAAEPLIPTITFSPRDNFTPIIVKHWIELAVRHNVPEAKILGMRQILAGIEKFRADHPTACKMPD